MESIYEVTDTSVPLGTIRGVEPYFVHVDFETLTEKPFGIFGRTGAGKSILNKLICLSILAKDVGSVLIFDMVGEYGVYSRADDTKGLKFYLPDKVEVFSLDPKNQDAKPFVLDPREIEPEDLLVALQDLSPGMIDTMYEINRRRGDRNLVTAIREASVEELGEEVAHEMSLNALKRRMVRISRLPFIHEGKDAFAQMMDFVHKGKSIVLDFGEFGGDTSVYLFVANVLAHRLYDQYMEKGETRRLVVFLEEAHKFLDPLVAPYTKFAQLARETRKFKLILALVDQRPTRIDSEIRSQLANRLILSLKEQTDIDGALAGVQDVAMWSKIVGTIPPQVVAAIGDAIRVPTVIDVMTYDDENVKENILGRQRMTAGDMEGVAEKAKKIFGSTA
ncbi:MAG TPA: ATP-binding protein [Thermoplasmata archaeon]|nr:ATP-binding protein [Thermoplasmata archaeon]